MDRRDVPWPALVAGLFLSLCSADASATTVKLMSLLEKTEACPVVVHGVVERVETRWAVFGARVETLVTLEVVEALKGDLAPGERITFRRGGGTIGEFTQTAPGLSRYEEGEEVVMFLEPYLETYVGIGIGIAKYDVEIIEGGAKYVFHDPKVAAVRFDSDEPIEVEPHPTMEPEPLHLFLKRVRTFARGLQMHTPVRPAKGARLKHLQKITTPETR